MTPKNTLSEYVVFSPNLRADDELANYWMRQATLRIRREIAWTWHERGGSVPQAPGELPPMIDKASGSLDLSRHWAEKQHFFAGDVAAKYLSEQISLPVPMVERSERGSFSWVVKTLELNDVSAFALALGLASAFDANFGAVIAACLNDLTRIHPNLMLIQRLWDQPEEVLTLADPLHPLFSHGLLRRGTLASRGYSENFWEQPLTVPAMAARALLKPGRR